MRKHDDEKDEQAAAAEEEAAEPAVTNLIRVRYNYPKLPKGHNPKSDGWPGAFWERDPAHPGGEVFVSGGAVVEVAETPMVQEALSQKRLVKA